MTISTEPKPARYETSTNLPTCQLASIRGHRITPSAFYSFCSTAHPNGHYDYTYRTQGSQAMSAMVYSSPQRKLLPSRCLSSTSSARCTSVEYLNAREVPPHPTPKKNQTVVKVRSVRVERQRLAQLFRVKITARNFKVKTQSRCRYL